MTINVLDVKFLYILSTYNIENNIIVNLISYIGAEMQILRNIKGFFKSKNTQQFFHKSFVAFDSFGAILPLTILIFSDNRSTCLASFYLFFSLYFLGQAISHYLLIKIPAIDVIKFDISIKRLIGIICFIEVAYLLLVIIFWQKSHIHPIYCAVCQYFQLPYMIGIVFAIHYIVSAGVVISLIHLFVSRKYYLIALGGFDVEQRVALEREQALRRVGLIEPNYAYPYGASIRGSKYYKFQDVAEPGVITQDICSICLNKKLEGQNIIRTNCNHFYHRECVQKWATLNSRCPDCRAEFDQQDLSDRGLVTIKKIQTHDKKLQIIAQLNHEDQEKNQQ